jgi:hypothetical protein
MLGERRGDAGRANAELGGGVRKQSASLGTDHRRPWATWEIDAQSGRAPRELSKRPEIRQEQGTRIAPALAAERAAELSPR